MTWLDFDEATGEIITVAESSALKLQNINLPLHNNNKNNNIVIFFLVSFKI